MGLNPLFNNSGHLGSDRIAGIGSDRGGGDDGRWYGQSSKHKKVVKRRWFSPENAVSVKGSVSPERLSQVSVRSQSPLRGRTRDSERMWPWHAVQYVPHIQYCTGSYSTHRQLQYILYGLLYGLLYVCRYSTQTKPTTSTYYSYCTGG